MSMTKPKEKNTLREEFRKEYPKYQYFCRDMSDFKKGEWINKEELLDWFESKLKEERDKIIKEIENAQQRATKLNDKVSSEYVFLFLQTLLEKLK